MRIERHATATVVATVLLMVMGSLVHGTGSSLACPDWPLCHGSFFPDMVQGVEFEHSHRLMALVVVALVGSLAVRAFRGPDRIVRSLTLLACALVVVQAALGALTVIYLLPHAISIAHLATSMAFLSVLVVIAARLRPAAEPRAGSGHRTLWGVAAALAYGQVILGAAVRHSGAVLACTGIPLCTGEVWPEASLSRLHVLHRLLAVIVLVVGVAASRAAYRQAGTGPQRAVALAPALLGIAQVSLGIGLVLAYAPLDLVTLHHLGGALLLASLVLGWALAPDPARRAQDRQRDSAAPAGALGVAPPS